MNTLDLLLNETLAELRKAWRQPAFAVPTLVLPLAFYAMFGIALSKPGAGNAGYLMATYGVFASLGPALFGFGAGLSAERDSGLLALKQVAPLPAGVYLGARLLTCFVFTLMVTLSLYVLAALGGGVALTHLQWTTLLAVHMAAVVPFCLLGLVVGLSFGGSGAMAVSNVLFMVLAVVGGLWVPVFLMPKFLQAAALVLPSFHLAELALLATGRDISGSAWMHALAVAGFAAVAGAMAFRQWQRT